MLVALVLAALALTGVISFVVAVIVLLLVVFGLLVFYGGGTSIAFGISDHDGFQRAVEEQEAEDFDDEDDEGEVGGHSDSEAPAEH